MQTTIVERVKTFKDGKPVVMEYRSIVTRKLRREALKRKQGNNKIHDSWVKSQIKAKPELKQYYELIAKGPAAHNYGRLLDGLSKAGNRRRA